MASQTAELITVSPRMVSWSQGAIPPVPMPAWKEWAIAANRKIGPPAVI